MKPTDLYHSVIQVDTLISRMDQKETNNIARLLEKGNIQDILDVNLKLKDLFGKYVSHYNEGDRLIQVISETHYSAAMNALDRKMYQ
ncbi:hypothetical protein C0585_03150 [Candidatus Woesearchaeota archaeon]|nr:MAG: hypothetical protein C0585_03150 [Candidatus Woesearchaeota archaeon]